MSSLLPPGYRFFPTEEELLSFYLYNKLNNQRGEMERVIPVVDVFSHEPWLFPELSGERSMLDPEQQWFFFCPQQEREARGGRTNRTTPSGYWKAAGSQSIVYSSTKRRLGFKRTMVFYEGRVSTGRKTKWKINEYRLFQDDATAAAIASGEPPKLRAEFSLCRVYIKSDSLRSFDRRPPAVADDTWSSSQKRLQEAPPASDESGSSGKR